MEQIVQKIIQKYQNDLESKLFNEEVLNQMDINKLEIKIKVDSIIATKTICSSAKKPKQTESKERKGTTF